MYAYDIESLHESALRRCECVGCAPGWVGMVLRVGMILGKNSFRLSGWTWGMRVSHSACVSLLQTHVPKVALQVKMEAAEGALFPCHRAPAAGH